VIDRPLGSLHPDGEELDAYVVGPETPVVEYEGEVVGVVLRADDVEDK
jgi:inorganic pyrophosphatase